MGVVTDFFKQDVGIASQGSSMFKSKSQADGNKKAIAIGAGVGAGVGALTGGLIEHSRAVADVQKQPVESVTLDWTEPVLASKNLGKIPQDQYQPGGFFGVFPHSVGQEDVVRKAPILKDDGTVAMNNMHKTFTDHGKPVVRWETQDIKDPFLNPSAPYTQSIWEDAYYRDDGQGHSVRYVNGFWVRYSPNIENKSLGTYQNPNVTFESGVNIGLRTFLGLLAGMGLGALSGAVLALVAKKAVEKASQS